MGYVYFIRSGNRERFKVGYTEQRVERRLKELQTGNPDKLEVYFVIESNEAGLIEGLFHSLLSEYQTEARNEWFAISEETLQQIIENERTKSGFYQAQGETDRIVGDNVRQVWRRQQHAIASRGENVLHSGDTPSVPSEHKLHFFSLGTK